VSFQRAWEGRAGDAEGDDSIEVDLYAGTEEPTVLSPIGHPQEVVSSDVEETGTLSQATFTFVPEVCTLLGGFCARPDCVVCGPIYARWKAAADWRQGTDEQLDEEVTMVVDALSRGGSR